MRAALNGLILAGVLAVLVPAQALAAADTDAAPAAERAPLTLVLNGVEKTIVMVVLPSGDALVAERDLVAGGVPLPAARYVTLGGQRYVSLASLAPKVTYSIDLANLELKLSADPALLPRTVTSMAGDRSRKGTATAVPSGFLNYTLSDNTLNPSASFNGFVAAGVGDAHGLLLASASYANGIARRGLVTFQTESDLAMHRLSVGDEFASTDMLGGSAIIGGIGVSRHFEFQPSYAYFPTPGLSGTALTPVTADVYVNGSFLRSVQLPPGQFDLTNLPVPAGANLTQVVLHDANGNSKTLNGLFYQAQQLLAKGVTDYNYHLGFVRPDPFGENDAYGPLAALGAYRLGLTDHVTVGARLEKTLGLISGGPQIEIGLPMGQLSLASGWSSVAGAAGNAFGAAYNVQTGRLTFDVSASSMSARYATSSLAPEAPRARSTVEEGMSMPLHKTATLSLSHTTTTFSNSPTADQLVASVMTQFRKRLNLNFSAERDRGSSIFGAGLGPARSTWTIGMSAGFNLSPGTGLSAETTSTSGSSASTLSISKSAPNGPGFGYIARATDSLGSTAADRSFSADLNYQTQVVDTQALLSAGGGARSSATLTMTGSLVGFKQGLFLSRPIADAYSLAELHGFSNMPVFLGDLYQGRTDRRGDLIVPVLEGYSENQVQIGEIAGAIDVVEDKPAIAVRPKAHQGVVASFAIHIVRAYVGAIVVHGRDGDVVPAFARLVLRDRENTFVSDLGSTGQFYIEGVPPGPYDAMLAGHDGLSCAFALSVPTASQPVTQLGTFRCEASR
jgi:outer membrane usher protein